MPSKVFDRCEKAPQTLVENGILYIYTCRCGLPLHVIETGDDVGGSACANCGVAWGAYVPMALSIPTRKVVVRAMLWHRTAGMVVPPEECARLTGLMLRGSLAPEDGVE